MTNSIDPLNKKKSKLQLKAFWKITIMNMLSTKSNANSSKGVLHSGFIDKTLIFKNRKLKIINQVYNPQNWVKKKVS